jgi:hypothetical protein
VTISLGLPEVRHARFRTIPTESSDAKLRDPPGRAKLTAISFRAGCEPTVAFPICHLPTTANHGQPPPTAATHHQPRRNPPMPHTARATKNRTTPARRSGVAPIAAKPEATALAEPAAPAALVPPAAPARLVATARPPTPQERDSRIAIAAYFNAEHRGFAAGHELEDWLAAEAEVDAELQG